MTRVMDGVRRVPAGAPRKRTVQTETKLAQPVVAAVVLARPVERRLPAAGGMDGVRRPRAISEQAAAKSSLRARQADADVRARRVFAFTWPQWRWLDLAAAIRQRMRWSTWKRPAMAVGMAMMALVVSGVTVRLISTPRASAAHAEAAPATPLATAAPTPAMAVEQTNLQAQLNAFMATHANGPFNIMVKDLDTGAQAMVNPDKSYMSASLYKLFVADQIYHMIDTGGLNYGAAAGGGSGNTIRGCLDLMITISDNTCGRALGTILNWGAQNPALAAQGFTETDLTTPQATSARDVANLFEQLYAGTLDSPASNSAFLTLLKNQKVNDRLPQGLPAGTVIAHKTGNLDGVVHDGGIVYGPKTNYVVVVMSGPWALPGDAPGQFATLSAQLWRFFEQ